MSFDAKFILAALNKHLDAVDAMWDRVFAAQDATWHQRVSSHDSALSAQASKGVPDLTQFATIGNEKTVVGGGLRDGCDVPGEHHFKAPIVADNWGGLFEQPAHMLEERELASTDEVRNSTDEIHTGSCLTSTDKDDITNTTAARCSTAGLIRGELVLAAVTAVPVPSLTSLCALGAAAAEMSASAMASTPSLLATTAVLTFTLAPAVLGAEEEVPDE